MHSDGNSRYGWQSIQAPYSCNCLAPVVLKIVRQLKCRSILDVGCGNGALCGMLHREGFIVTGVDRDTRGMELARQAYPQIPFFELGVYDSPDKLLQAEKMSFDCVVSTEVIEHLYSPQYLPLFASMVLRADGYLIISTPYHGFLKNLALSLFNHWDDHHAALWDGGHIKFWSRKTLTRLLEKNGFSVLAFHGVGRVPFLWKSMILVARKQGVDV